MIGSHRPRYGVEMTHDYEAGGSASQTVHGFDSAPPPATYPTSWEQDPWELRTQPADAQSAGPWDPQSAGPSYPQSAGPWDPYIAGPSYPQSAAPWDPYTAGTGTHHMYSEGPGEVGHTDDDDEDPDDEDEDMGDDSGDGSPQRRVQPHRHGKGVAAPRLSLSGRRRRR